MSIPKAIRLTSVKTGEVLVFGSVAQTAEFMKRSKGYFFWKLENLQTNHVESRDGEEYIMEFIGVGHRRDWNWKAEKERKGPPREYSMMVCQLCTGCARAVGFCEWSARLEPVPGWDAIESKNMSDEGSGYQVKGCPKYLPDAPTKEERKLQRMKLMEELVRENREKRKTGPAASSPAVQGEHIRAAAQAMAAAAAGASDQRECTVC